MNAAPAAVPDAVLVRHREPHELRAARVSHLAFAGTVEHAGGHREPDQVPDRAGPCVRRRRVDARSGGVPPRPASAYELRDGTRIWIITEADRSVTTILPPEEY